jgi:hypothetical protein
VISCHEYRSEDAKKIAAFTSKKAAFLKESFRFLAANLPKFSLLSEPFHGGRTITLWQLVPDQIGKETKMTTNNKPAFEAFTVRESKGKSYFTKVGAVWPTKSGNGFNVDLHALPIDGKLTLLPPKDKSGSAHGGVLPKWRGITSTKKVVSC